MEQQLGLVHTLSLAGLDGRLIDVRADLTDGPPAFVIAGLPDSFARETRDRIRAALVNAGLTWPQHAVTVSLSPTPAESRASSYDLAIAVAVLVATGVIPAAAVHRAAFLGELGLDGRVRPVTGVLTTARSIVATVAVRQLVVPRENLAEVALLRRRCNVVGVANLAGLVAHFTGGYLDTATVIPPGPSPQPAITETQGMDFADVIGHAHAKRCLEVGAAGDHHVFLGGPSGAGKTMLATRLPTILPRLSAEEALDVAAVRSLAGLLMPTAFHDTVPPLRAPHPDMTTAALIGGGSAPMRPGELALAHRGVLLVDDARRFPPKHLELLSQPLDSGFVVVARGGTEARYPAQFLLVLAAETCLCGERDQHCGFTDTARHRYLARLPMAIVDRLDIRIVVSPADQLGDSGDPSAAMRSRVIGARERAARRLRDTPWRTNGRVPAWEVRRLLPVDAEAIAPAHAACEAGAISVRAMDRVVAVAWTLADLDGDPSPTAAHVADAVALRKGITRG